MKKFIIFVTLMLILSACSTSAQIQPTNPNPAVLVKTSTPLPTATNSPTPTATATLTATPTNRPAKVLAPIITVTVGPTQSTAGGLIWPRAKFTEANVTWRTTACAEPGKNLSCEMEYRKDAAGCYVGASCYDDCGWYYSVNTIPAGVEEFSAPCF